MELTKKIELTRHIGAEFLTWVAFRSSAQEGVITTSAGPVEVEFIDRVTFISPYAASQASMIKGENPIETAEARMALRRGRLVEDARLQIQWQGKPWTFNWSGPKFLASGVKVPAVLGDNEEEAVMERFELMRSLEDILGSLYHAFLELRLDDKKWGAEIETMRKWLKED